MVHEKNKILLTIKSVYIIFRTSSKLFFTLQSELQGKLFEDVFFGGVKVQALLLDVSVTVIAVHL